MAVLTFDIGGTMLKYGLFDEQNLLVLVGEEPTDLSESKFSLIAQITRLYQKYGRQTDRVGVSCTGQINGQTGEIIYATDALPHLNGINLRKLLQNELHVPTAVENDVNCAALGELYFGAGKGLNSFLCLTFGTGIGGAIVKDGELLCGHSGNAGEFGHIVIHANGKRCLCGQAGCYEAYASANALIREVRLALEDHALSANSIIKMIRNRHPIAFHVYHQWLDYVAAGLASLIHTFSPSHILLGGRIMENNWMVQDIQALTQIRIMDSYRDVQLIAAALGNRAGMYGALHLSRQLSKGGMEK